MVLLLIYIYTHIYTCVINVFLLLSPSGHIMTLGSTQLPTEMSIRDIFLGVKVAGA